MIILSIVLLLHSVIVIGSDAINVAIKAQDRKKVTIGLVCVGHIDSCVHNMINRLVEDLEWSDQCIIERHSIHQVHNVSDVKKSCSDQVGIALFINQDDKNITWRLYDCQEVAMIGSGVESYVGIAPTLVAHTIADSVWPLLFGKKSSFRSKIAYSEQVWHKKHGRLRPYKQIWVADFDGTNAQLFIDNPTTSFAARWNNDVNFPVLFFSENTLSNVQLVMNNMFGKRKVLCSFDGLNMQPTFSSDGKKIVFCLSKDGTTQLYYSYIKSATDKRVYERLTFNTGNNIAPCFIDDHTVVFVSDFETNKPQLYTLSLNSKEITRITHSGYCACPRYSSVADKLVYSKMIDSQMQLFTYDFKTGQHEQLTFDQGNKEEPSWSACGNWIVFCTNGYEYSRLAQYNVCTKKIKYLTSTKKHCSYPDYSPIYKKSIGILAC